MKSDITERERRRLKVSQKQQKVMGTPHTETNMTYQNILESLESAQKQKLPVATIEEEEDSPVKKSDSKVFDELDEKAKLKLS